MTEFLLKYILALNHGCTSSLLIVSMNAFYLWNMLAVLNTFMTEKI